jgi:SAM-dependent methyltransferase
MNPSAAFRLAALAILALCAAWPAAAQDTTNDNLAGPYVPTPRIIVDEMLKLADIGPGDTVYDLGSGDGRLVITAAKRFGARGVGVELQKELVELASAGAAKEGVADRVKFLQGDLFESDIREATVVTLYLLPRFVTRLVPKLRAELRPGARIVSHDYPLAPWPPNKELSLDVPEKEMISGTAWTRLYYYVVPARVGGGWELSLPKALAADPLVLLFVQEPDALEGSARDGSEKLPVRDLALRGERIHFGLLYKRALLVLEGTVAGERMAGEVRTHTLRESWSARRIGAPQR